MMWAWSAQSSGSSYDLIAKDGALTDFRLVAYELHDYIEGYRAAHRGENLALNTPTMFFNKGNGTVEWMKPTQSHSYKLERSVNGGTWTVIATSGAAVDSVGRKYTYQDTTLPTSGTAKFSSPLSVDDFIKKTQFIYYTRDALAKVAEDVAYFAEAEGLTAHAKSAVIRIQEA